MREHFHRILGVALLVGAAATTAFAGGPIFIFDPANKIPYAWEPANWPGGAVPVYTDLGALGRLSNARADQLAVQGWQQWNDVASSDFAAQVVGDFSLLGLGDITSANITQIIGTDNGGGIHVVYDHDGNIMRNFFGVSPTSVLGISNVEFSAIGTSEIVEAYSVISGPGVRATDPNGIGFAGVFTHEFGHTINLAHTTTNGQTGNPNNDQPQPRDCAAPWTGKPPVSTYETMFPNINPVVGGSGEFMFTVERIDDIAAISNLYPAPGWPENFGTIRGTIRAKKKATGNSPEDLYEVTGVNVIARRLDDPFGNASSNASGGLSQGLVGADGSFELNGLTPGADYLVYVDNFLTGSYPTAKLLVLPGPEEFYNGVNESGDGLTDDRCAYTAIRAEAGSPVTADMTFNRVKGAPEFIAQPSPGAATDISADGGVVVGSIGLDTVYRWDVATGAMDIIPGGRAPGSVAVSDDGTKILATAAGPDGRFNMAFYENGAWTVAPPLPGMTTPCFQNAVNLWGAGFDISGDGSTIVGYFYTNGCSQSGIRAAKWNTIDGSVLLPKYDSPTRLARANAVNYDGSVIVGRDDATNGFNRAAVWSGGTVQLVQPNASQVGASEALDVTRDGSIVVGGHHDNQAWKSSASDGLVDLGKFPNTRAFAQGISDDGSVIVGFADSAFSRTGAIWTAELGWADFTSFMNSQGTYFQDVSALPGAITPDGRTFAGFASTIYGNTGWVIKSPKVVICHRSPDNPNQKTRTIDVTFPEGMHDHLLHGDTVGLCQHGGQ